MSTTIRLQASHSRNSNDWTMKRTATGRYALLANEKGVSLRIGLLVEYLYENGHSNKNDMTAYLQGVHRSYNEGDVSQPLKQMIKAGIVKVTGKGRDATYSLTNNGRRIWNAATLKWV